MTLRSERQLYYEMLRIRRVEEAVAELYRQGHIAAPVHLSIGQEAVAVGVMSALEQTDKIVSTHRCHGHYLAKGGNLKKMFAELLGKETGCCRGYGGTMHLFDDKAGHVVSSPLVGASISFAVGIALAAKLKGEPTVAVAFFGDGATEEGIFWESLNFASVHKLPVVFVCENNLYATHSHILKRQPSDEIVSRVRPHGVSVQRVDGNDVCTVYSHALQAVAAARHGIPVFLEAQTYRIREHWGINDDAELGYRSREEIEKWRGLCPIGRLTGPLFGDSHDKLAAFEKEIAAEIREATCFALGSPLPRAPIKMERGPCPLTNAR